MKVTVIILNYNGKQWIEKCIKSVLTQTLRPQLEVIVCDNNSSDGSDQLALQQLKNEDHAKFIQTGKNLGFCAGNNVGAAQANGEYLFFLNNDAWLERECLEKLVAETDRWNASAATPSVLNWSDDFDQWVYGAGFDMFGLPSFRKPARHSMRLFMPPGCSYLIRRDVFFQLGQFDPYFFMYADEYDLSWRLWIAGHQAIVVPQARLHHRGAADVNPEGGDRITLFQTSISKRYYTNRNCLLTLLKSSQHLLYGIVALQVFLLLVESIGAYAVTKNWTFVRKAYYTAIHDAFTCKTVKSSRIEIKKFRKHGDFFMVRFVRLRLNRLDEFLKLLKMGFPKVKNR